MDESQSVLNTIRMMIAHSVLWQKLGQCDLLFFLFVYMYSVLCNICFYTGYTFSVILIHLVLKLHIY